MWLRFDQLPTVVEVAERFAVQVGGAEYYHDLGNSLAYWVQADDTFLMKITRRQPTHLPGMLRRDEVVAYYLERTGLKPENWTFYEVYGLFRLAVIAQQIYFRYHHKQTRNPAFRNFWILVNYFDWRCRGLIRKAGA